MPRPITDFRAVLKTNDIPLPDAAAASALQEQGVLSEFTFLSTLGTTCYYGVAVGHTLKDVQLALEGLVLVSAA